MRVVILFLLWSICPSFFAQSAHVLFGERDLKNPRLAVYIDKEGSLYPDHPISNSALDSCGASLLKWYERNPMEFLVIAKQYNCGFETYDPGNARVLNDSIISFCKRNILSKKGDYGSVSFLVHGYRKPFVKTNGDRTSLRDYAILEETILETLKTLCVEVYWDAMYDCCYSTNRKKNKVLYGLLKEAERNASPVGHGLRKVIHGLDFETVNVITHSLGAKVAMHAMFNADDCGFATPEQTRINLCLIAPAVSGDDSFKDYHQRNTGLDFASKDNYRLVIGYNEHDFVLRKKVGWFGPGPYRYVNTTLGCNHKGCASDFQRYFTRTFPNSTLKLFDLSSVGQCHLVGCYCSSGHLTEMLEYIK